MGHRDFYAEITDLYGFREKTVSLSTKEDSELVLRSDFAVINLAGIIPKSHGNSIVSKAFDQIHASVFRKKCPGYKKNIAHTYSDGAPVERISASVGKQYCIDSKSSCASDDSARICGISYVFDNCDSFCIFADFIYSGEKSPISTRRTGYYLSILDDGRGWGCPLADKLLKTI